MEIRSETLLDYAAIADVNARAFGSRAAEASIVALCRQDRTFDRELSLLAVESGRIVGHAFFTPHMLRLLDTDVPAVQLGPLAVVPERQREGIGARLMAAGHEAAASRGYAVCFLVGHASYYPRFGYVTRVYGAATTEVNVTSLPSDTLESRPVEAKDIPALQVLQRDDEREVDFSFGNGPDLIEWVSPNPGVTARVYLDGDDIAGYVRLDASAPAAPRVFIARGQHEARAMASTIARAAGPDVRALTLPIHPRQGCAGAFPPGTVQPWNAAMARSLHPSPLEEYIDRVRAGERPAGRVIWPVYFDL